MDKYLGSAYECLEQISADEEKRREYEQREKAIRDFNYLEKQFREEGRAKGRAEVKHEIIENMRKCGFSEEQIKLACGLN